MHHDILSLENLYSLLDIFGNKLQYKQFHNLISNFNNKTIKLLDDSDKLDKDYYKSSCVLAKIALISNFINEKEKEFKEKYFKVDDEFENVNSKLGDIINEAILQKYHTDNVKQMEYYANNMHNRELYEKGDGTEDVLNDLKVDKDDEIILNKLKELNNELKTKTDELKNEMEQKQIYINTKNFVKKLEAIKQKMK